MSGTSSTNMNPSVVGMSKVFMLDKYFSELQKFWDTEKRLQDATSTGDAVALQNRLQNLNTGLESGLQDLTQYNGLPVVPGSHRFISGQQNNYQNDDFQQTIRSNKSQGTTEAVSLANVSDPNSGTGSSNNANKTGGSSSIHHSQHNYSNVQHPHSHCDPAPKTTNTSNGGSLTSSRTQSSNASPANAMLGPDSPFGGGSLQVPPNVPPPPVPDDNFGRRSTPLEERIKKREQQVAEEAKKSKLAELQDLIHLEQPINEDLVLRALQSRFFSRKFFTNVGPILLAVNPYCNVGNPLNLESTKDNSEEGIELKKVAEEAVRLQTESGYPQAIIVSGISGSGKTHASMVLLRHLFTLAEGVNHEESDTFKHLSAAFTVLRSLGSAQTATNKESSRIGNFIEVQVTENVLYRTKIHCYFLDQGRVVKPPPTEKSYHIFYQMMAGLHQEERIQLGLDGFTVRDLNYLNIGDIRQDETEDAKRFEDWRTSLAILGIPFMDVVRVLSAILLLGNVIFTPGLGDDAFDVELMGKDELNSVAKLLGISSTLLWQGLTMRTHSVRGQPIQSMSDSHMCNATRDALAKALYCRTVATIVRRANSFRRAPMGGTLGSESTESTHLEVASHHASTVGTSNSRKSSRSMQILNNALRHATDGFIGILDMFGFEDSKPSQLEQLCINLSSETMQHFYNTHIFKSSIESCRDEGIASDVVIDYIDNVPCIDLISSLRTGLLSMLDVECSVRGFPATYVQKVKVQHKENRKLFEPKHCDLTRTFGIHHYAGSVVYDTSQFLETNKDVIADDIVSVFAREQCQFGFATHLFGNELKSLANAGGSGESSARGASFRISPTSTSHTMSNTDTLLNGDEPVSTLTQDFHTRLDNLLRTLVHAKPHFVRCIAPNEHDSDLEFDRTHVTNQVRSLQVLETVNLMARGFPHRMRFKAFNARYKMLSKPIGKLHRTDEKTVEDCEIILDSYSLLAKDAFDDTNETKANNKDWAHGRKHIFLSEGARQQLESLRILVRKQSATRIQATFRGFLARRKMAMAHKVQSVNNNLMLKSTSNNSALIATTTTTEIVSSSQNLNLAMATAANNFQYRSSGRPKPISGTPPPAIMETGNGNNTMQTDKCDFRTIQMTCSLFGLDLERPPPVPPSRPYTVIGGKKITFPQSRVMKMSYPDEGTADVILMKGEPVIVIGNSPRRGHLVVEKQNHTIHIPFQYLELKRNF